MTMTMAPPVVQPSLGLMALIHGVTAQQRKLRVTARVEDNIMKDECSQHVNQECIYPAYGLKGSTRGSFLSRK